MLAQKRNRARVRERGVFGTEACAALAVEAMPGTGVDVEDAGRIRLADALDALRRDRLILVAEMVKDRAARPLVEMVDDRGPVIRHGRRDWQADRGHMRDRAAPAKAHDADRHVAERVD